MKGTEEKRGKGGIDQIVTLKNKLKEELRTFFPTKLKVHLQGILLTPFGSQSPDKKIIEQKKQGFVILPLQCDRSAELYNYISDPIIEHSTSVKKYVDLKISESKSFLMEELLAKRALDQRNKDNYDSQKFCQSKDRQDIYIDYLLPNNKDWITLFTSSEHKKVQLAYSSNDEQASDKENAIQKIQKELETLNLTNIVEIINRSLITKRSS